MDRQTYRQAGRQTDIKKYVSHVNNYKYDYSKKQGFSEQLHVVADCVTRNYGQKMDHLILQLFIYS